ncbi:MAG: hypothetical protein MUF23_10605 [Pirellula sp.]|jgi:hypothetical protein|nr:hypothetical protein [Pirellula sp.]
MSRVAVWIDQSQAIIIRLDECGESIEEIAAGHSPATHLYDAVHGQVPFPLHSDTTSEREKGSNHHWDGFLEDVIERIGQADAIWIIGPGEPKLELEKRLANHPHLHALLQGVDPLESMTLVELMKHVRNRFHVAT